jgi:hypothetical protein
MLPALTPKVNKAQSQQSVTTDFGGNLFARFEPLLKP